MKSTQPTECHRGWKYQRFAISVLQASSVWNRCRNFLKLIPFCWLILATTLLWCRYPINSTALLSGTISWGWLTYHDSHVIIWYKNKSCRRFAKFRQDLFKKWQITLPAACTQSNAYDIARAELQIGFRDPIAIDRFLL